MFVQLSGCPSPADPMVQFEDKCTLFCSALTLCFDPSSGAGLMPVLVSFLNLAQAWSKCEAWRSDKNRACPNDGSVRTCADLAITRRGGMGFNRHLGLGHGPLMVTSQVDGLRRG